MNTDADRREDLKEDMRKVKGLSVEATVIDVLKDELFVDKIDNDVELKDDLGMGDIDYLNVLLEIDARIGIELELKKMEKLGTVQDLIEYVGEEWK